MRFAGDHEHAVDPGQIGRQIVDKTVCEILLIGIIAKDGERQYDDRHARHQGSRYGYERHCRRLDLV